ncbi:MAG TPA: PDZ domain-containing protein [Pseudidiomarina sp.]|nr:PDZ domain-containing protein [Pseudidiomarina sp.]
MLQYNIVPRDVFAHLFEVTLTISDDQPEGTRLRLPAWIPGSYMIRDFARHLIGLRATCNNQEVPVVAIDKQTWQLPPHQGVLTITYQVYAFDLSVRTAYLDQQFGFFNHSSLCLGVEGFLESPCEVQIQTPPEHPQWRIATGLTRHTGEAFDAGTFTAKTYDELLDHPVLMGELAIADFIAGGIKHSLVFAGRQYADMDRICGDLARVCEHQIKLFGNEPPFDHYLFMTMVVGKGFGGLEHRNSTALVCSRKDLPAPGKTQLDNDYRTFLSLCSHEYFHSWNVKSLKPREFIPYQLEHENYTRQLWFYEGVTSYYDDFVLHQSGLIDAPTYLSLLGDTIARVYRGKGVERQTVTESSLHAWTKYYKQDENSPNAIVSYYTKGALITLCLDLLIRQQTDHRVTFADVMRDLWQRYGKTAEGTDESTLVTFLQEHYPVHVQSFLERALNTTEPLPLDELLASFGVSLTAEIAADDNTFGGKISPQKLPVSLGAKYKASSSGLELQVVYHDEAAHRAGLSAMDRIIAIDYLQVTDTTIREVLERFKPNQRVTVHAFRRDELLQVELNFQAPKANNRILRVIDSEKAKNWLRIP